MPEFQVTVGNVGTVYNGADGAEASRVYATYRAASKSTIHPSRAQGEKVVLWQDGEPVFEFCPLEYACGVTQARLDVARAKLALAYAERKLEQLVGGGARAAWFDDTIQRAALEVKHAEDAHRDAQAALEEAAE